MLQFACSRAGKGETTCREGLGSKSYVYVYNPCFGCVRRHEGAEVGRILANFCNSEASKIASSLCKLAFWSVGIPWHSAYCAKFSRVGFFVLKWNYNNFWGLWLVSIIYFCKKIFINPPFSFILLTFLSNFYLNHRGKDGSFLYSSAKLDLLLWPVSVWLKANLSPFYWLLVKHVFLCFPFSFCIVLWKYVTSLQAVKNYPPTGRKKMTTLNPIQEKVYVFN